MTDSTCLGSSRDVRWRAVVKISTTHGASCLESVYLFPCGIGTCEQWVWRCLKMPPACYEVAEVDRRSM